MIGKKCTNHYIKIFVGKSDKNIYIPNFLGIACYFKIFFTSIANLLHRTFAMHENCKIAVLDEIKSQNYKVIIPMKCVLFSCILRYLIYI